MIEIAARVGLALLAIAAGSYFSTLLGFTAGPLWSGHFWGAIVWALGGVVAVGVLVAARD